MLSRLQAYAELLRLSNVLTAVADVWMGMVLATGVLRPSATACLLTAGSVLMYLGGMVLNDALDADRDAVERPNRPVPSGRISVSTASILAWGLLTSGVAAAYLGGALSGTRLAGGVAMALAGCVVAYDHLLKATPLGPFAMGACRALNGLLGMSIGLNSLGGVGPTADGLATDGGATIDASLLPLLQPADAMTTAAGVLVYIAGVTLFARDEAQTGDRGKLWSAALLAMAGLATLAAGPWLTDLSLVVSTQAWLLMWGVITLLIARKFAVAILQPSPRRVQRAVGNALQAIILIDAALAWGYAGPFWGLAIFALLPP
ncbi:MAG: UbiA family prenyltransferase, partial [Planctomycetota bacterium]